MHAAATKLVPWAVAMSLLLVLPWNTARGANVGLGAPTPPLPRIVNGIETRGYPTAGALMHGSRPDTASLLCSGTLIGCQTFLTAAHCVEDDADPAHYFVFLQHGGIFAVSSLTIHLDYSFPVADVAVLKLSVAETGISPTPINTNAVPPPGTSGIIVGFGRAGGTDFDYGLKRYGVVSTAPCIDGISDATSVCWNFDSSLGPPGTDSNTCNGDSGGPLLIDFGSGDTVAGITSGGVSDNCLADDASYDANVFYYRTWIEAKGGTDLTNTTCGSIPQVGDPETKVLALSGQLDSGNPEETHTATIADGTVLLRIAMNGADDRLTDFDLYVKAGGPPTLADFDCKADGAHQFGFCEFAGPSPGTWYVLVDRYSGSGRYQLTVTTFGIDCTNPANEGSPCDDGNVCTGPDFCTSGVCGGPAAADGTPCDDGSLCTRSDQCQAGACLSGSSPTIGCKLPSVAGKALLKIKNTTPDSRDRLVWRWLGGSTTTKAEYGNPAAGGGYALCVYDEVGGVPQLAVEVPLPTGAKWDETNDGFKYHDSSAKAGAVRNIQLRAGPDGKASILVTSKGEILGLGPADPFKQDGTVKVQLVSDSTCWEADYSASIVNDGMVFRAKGD
jgi:hypothetical protein